MWKSNAKWPESCGVVDNVSTDTHDTQEQAIAVCQMMKENGFGGDRKEFPIKTWITTPEGLDVEV
jgi:hypothetical protein